MSKNPDTMTKAELIKLCSELETTVKEQAEEIENPRNDRIALDYYY